METKWIDRNTEEDELMTEKFNSTLDELWRKRFTGTVSVTFIQGLIDRFRINMNAEQ